jgi:hypothetical protein
VLIVVELLPALYALHAEYAPKAAYFKPFIGFSVSA